MTNPTQADTVITPATWPQQMAALASTPAGLRHLVGWFGSTHAAAMWRKNDAFLAPFRQYQISGFDPQIEDWDPSFAATEAEVMATAAVIIIRLENNELTNGSLGSIAEVGLALTSAALQGQAVIVSIEDDLLTSLDEAGAIAQYMLLEMAVEDVGKISALDGLLHIHRGDDLAKLAKLACRACQAQMDTPQTAQNYPHYLALRAQRQRSEPLRVLIGGSGGPYAPAYQARFKQKKAALSLPYQNQNHRVKILSEGAIAEAWHIPYNTADRVAAGVAIRTLLSIEREYKKEADRLLLPIMAEATSKGACTEIGILLLNALVTGQLIEIHLEPFDPVDYIRSRLSINDWPATLNDEGDARRQLQAAGVADRVLAIATQPQVLATAELVSQMQNPDQPVSFKQVKGSLLRQTDAFQEADNARRVRSLVQAHLERLQSHPDFGDFFQYSTEILVD